MGFEDLQLSKDTGPARGPAPRRARQTSTSRWVIVAAGSFVAGVVLTMWWMSRAQPPPVIPAPTSAAALTEQSARRPSPQPMQLPALVDSDAMLRELAGTLSRNPLLARLVAPRGIVKNAALAVIQIGEGKTPSAPLSLLRPPTRLSIAADTGRVDAASFARWEAATQALLSIPAKDAAQVYVNVKPLFDQAYRDLGTPEGDFDVALTKAIRTLETTPAAPLELVLERREGYFEHVDPALQSLQPVQKQLILLGPDNRARVLSWLRQFGTALDLKIGR